MNGFTMPKNKSVLDYQVHICSHFHKCIMCADMINPIEIHFKILTGQFVDLYFCLKCRDN